MGTLTSLLLPESKSVAESVAITEPTDKSSERFGTTGTDKNIGALSLASVMFTVRVAIDDRGLVLELSTRRRDYNYYIMAIT